MNVNVLCESLVDAYSDNEIIKLKIMRNQTANPELQEAKYVNAWSFRAFLCLGKLYSLLSHDNEIISKQRKVTSYFLIELISYMHIIF